MDTGSIIIGIIFIIICALPFIFFNRRIKKQKARALHSLFELADKNNCQIDKYEVLNGILIGIDETHNCVFYYRKIDEVVVEHVVDITAIQRCTVENTSRMASVGGHKQSVVERLELCFYPSARNLSEIKLEFFNADINPQLNGELQSIHAWANCINSHIKSVK